MAMCYVLCVMCCVVCCVLCVVCCVLCVVCCVMCYVLYVMCYVISIVTQKVFWLTIRIKTNKTNSSQQNIMLINKRLKLQRLKLINNFSNYKRFFIKIIILLTWGQVNICWRKLIQTIVSNELVAWKK